MDLTCAGCGRSYWRNQAWMHASCVSMPVSTAVSTPSVSTKRRAGVSTDYERVKRWRVANRERYNQKMRELRARKRGDVKADR